MVNKIKQKAYNQAHHRRNKEKIRLRKKLWREANKEKIVAYSKVYCIANKDKIDIRKKSYREANKEKEKARMKIWYLANSEKVKEYREKWRKINPKYHTEYTKKRYKTDPKFKLKTKISIGIGLSLKGNKNGRHWETLVGYTLEILKKHLEKLFTKGMTWDNYGFYGWHVDHKIPIAVHNFTKPSHEDFKRCWALSNLQPLWAHDNHVKHCNIDKHFQPSLLI